jgi:hypothetical protein
MAKLDTDNLLTPFDGILEEILHKGNTKQQYILISYYISEELSRRVSLLEASGVSVQWIFIKDKSRKIDFARRPGMYVCEVNY